MDSATEPPGKPRFHLVFNLFLETKAGERASGGLGGTTEEDRGKGRAGWAVLDGDPWRVRGSLRATLAVLPAAPWGAHASSYENKTVLVLFTGLRKHSLVSEIFPANTFKGWKPL